VSTPKWVFEPADPRRFKIVNPGTNEVVGGFENIERGNVYLTAYPARLKDQKPIDALDVGESSLHRYSLSGTSAVYAIVRTK